MEQRGTVATCHIMTCGTTLPCDWCTRWRVVAGVHMRSCAWCTRCHLVAGVHNAVLAGVHSVVWLVTKNVCVACDRTTPLVKKAS